jgi:hypothetical protein
MLAARCQQDLAFGRYLCLVGYPVLQGVDGVVADGVRVEALSRMSHSNLQRHSGRPPAAACQYNSKESVVVVRGWRRERELDMSTRVGRLAPCRDPRARSTAIIGT